MPRVEIFGAAGDYGEAGKSVQLYGRCPGLCIGNSDLCYRVFGNSYTRYRFLSQITLSQKFSIFSISYIFIKGNPIDDIGFCCLTV